MGSDIFGPQRGNAGLGAPPRPSIWDGLAAEVCGHLERFTHAIGRQRHENSWESTTTADGCLCSVREQLPSTADSNQERAGNLVELREVTGASWSLSLP